MAKLVRYLVPQIQRDLARKMVFVAGPRQVGKTTIALAMTGGRAGYLNNPPPQYPNLDEDEDERRGWRNGRRLTARLRRS